MSVTLLVRKSCGRSDLMPVEKSKPGWLSGKGGSQFRPGERLSESGKNASQSGVNRVVRYTSNCFFKI